MLLSSSDWDLLGFIVMAGNGGIIEVDGGGWIFVKKLRRVGGGDIFIMEVCWRNTLHELEEESLVLLSSSNWDLLGFIVMAGNGGIIEVDGGGWIFVKKLIRVGGGDIFILEVCW